MNTPCLGALILTLTAGAVWAQDTCLNGTVTLETGAGTRKLAVRIADTTKERAFGLGRTPDFSTDDGMLFVYPEPRSVSGFMVGEVPVDLVTFDAQGGLLRNAPEYAEMVDGGDGMLHALILRAGRSAELGLDDSARLSGWTCNTPG